MEAFSLLKYWRGGGGGGGGGGVKSAANAPTSVPTTIISSISNPPPEEEEEEEKETQHEDDDGDEENDNDDDDDGSFFDLEFAVPDEGEEDDDDEEEEDRDYFAVSSSSGDVDSGGRTDPNLALSPSDDLFFKGKLVQLEPSSIVYSSSEPNSRAQFPVSLLKSATKFRVFLLGFKKPKPSAVEPAGPVAAAAGSAQKPQSRFFTVKLKVEEVPIVSLFTRDNSSRSSSNPRSQKPQPTSVAAEEDAAGEAASAADAKRFAKVVMQKYLKMIKPLYVKVSRRYGEKLRFSGQLNLGLGKAASPAVGMQETSVAAETEESGDPKPEAAPAPAPAVPPANGKSQKQVNLPAGLRVVCKHLGKSRSASSAIVAPPPVAASQRRDDSLLQQQDGIQSAIAHCKRSFNASKVISDSMEEISLARSCSDPCTGKNVDGFPRNSMKGKEACV